MDNNNNSSKKNLQNFAAKIREKATSLQSNKSMIAGFAVDRANKQIDRLGHLVDVMENAVSAYRSIQKISKVIANDPGVREKVSSLIANAVNDFGVRMNEFSGVIDYISKSEELVKELDNFRDNMRSASKKAAEAAMKFEGKTKLSVVDEDPSDDGTTH